MEIARVSKGILRGEVIVPPSKSAAHRAIFCASLASGESIIKNIIYSEDISATINAMKKLGAEIECGKNWLKINGNDTFLKRTADLDCNESGSTLRFLIPVAAAGGVEAEFTGKGRLPDRPIGIYLDLLPKMGVKCISEGGLPLNISGTLKSGKYYIPGNISSQFITGLLFALPLLEGDSEIILTTELESKGYIDLTVQIQRKFGVNIEGTGRGWRIKGSQKYNACEYIIEGDWSQASFFMAAGALGSEITLKGLDLNSLQGDRECLEIFRKFGADIKVSGGDIQISGGNLKGMEIDASQIPDLVPVLAVTASLAKGETIISGARRLKIKESDRLKAISDAINNIGGDVKVLPDGLKINGSAFLKGGKAEGCNDHRIVMSMAIAALKSAENVEISDPFSINKSYPSFFEDFNMLGGNANVVSLG